MSSLLNAALQGDNSATRDLESGQSLKHLFSLNFFTQEMRALTSLSSKTPAYH